MELRTSLSACRVEGQVGRGQSRQRNEFVCGGAARCVCVVEPPGVCVVGRPGVCVWWGCQVCVLWGGQVCV